MKPSPFINIYKYKRIKEQPEKATKGINIYSHNESSQNQPDAIWMGDKQLIYP